MVLESAGGRKAKAAETETALKEAAKRVFERHGYLNTKITDITREAGRAAGSFYNHFASKEQLLEALVADMLAQGDEIAMQHPEDHDLSDVEHMRFHIAGFWYAFREFRAVFIALLQASMVDEAFASRLRELMSPDQAVMIDHLEYVRDKGIELPGDPAVLASAMTGMWLQFAYTWQVNGGENIGRELPDEEAIDLLTQFSLRGIAGRVT